MKFNIELQNPIFTPVEVKLVFEDKKNFMQFIDLIGKSPDTGTWYDLYLRLCKVVENK